jgi:hypothetical protein
MQFPLEWTFADVANLEAYQYSRTEDRKLGMEIIVHFLDGKAGDFVLGGASIVSMKFDGSKIFGPRFEGKKLLLKANITSDIPELIRIRPRRIRTVPAPPDPISSGSGFMKKFIFRLKNFSFSNSQLSRIKIVRLTWTKTFS